ncbi:MAG: hypothetical protein WCG92_10205 [Hyphomicrobiales bacterium]|nr:hypothetical protein [Alphaproteobacteria bacterium]
MPRPFTKDPTAFFSVVGVPYISEHHAMDFPVRERRTDDQRPRTLEIGFATICVGFCTVMLGVPLFASDGAARLVEVAFAR